MTDSSPRRSSTELQPPDNSEDIKRTFEGYRLALRTLTPAELMAETARLSSLIERENRTLLNGVVTKPLEDYISSLDTLVLRSTPPSRTPPGPSPTDRGQPRSPSPQPTPADLLFGSGRGKRLVGKLVASNARSINAVRRR